MSLTQSLPGMVLLRSIGLGLLIAVYDGVVLPALIDSGRGPDGGGGANIGAGLLAFALIAGFSLVWSWLDGRRHPWGSVAVVWALVGVIVGLGWLTARALNMDGSMTPGELFVADWDQVIFVALLIAVPGAFGAAIGRATSRRPPANTP